MAAASKFPAIVSLEYQRNGQMLPAMRQDIDSAFNAAGRQAENAAKRIGDGLASMTDKTIKSQLDAAIGRFKTSAGALDLDLPGLRTAVAAQQQMVAAANQLAAAYRSVGSATGAMSAETTRATAAADALAHEEAQALQIAKARLVVAEQLQTALNRQVAASGVAVGQIGRLHSANDNVTASAGQQRMALQQLSFQLNDVATMYAMGARPAQIFASQAGQVTQALGLLGGSAGRIGSFLGGPWGLAITSAAVVMVPFISKLFEADKALEDVQFSSHALGSAQGILGNVMDLTTGKINTQNAALIALAKAQIQVAQVQAKTRAGEARAAIQALQTPTMRFGGGLGGGFSLERQMPIEGQVSKQMLAGAITSSQAIDKLEQLRELGRITDAQFNTAAASVANLGVELENLKVYEQAEKALDGGSLGSLAKPAKTSRTKKPKGSDEARKLNEFAETTAEKIRRLNEQFDESPRLVDRVSQATRELDAIISELSKKDPVRFAEMIEGARAAKVVVHDALQRPFQDLLKSSAEQARFDELILANKTEEAEVQRQLYALVQKQGALLPDQEVAVRAIVAQERVRAKLLENQAAARERELRTLESTRNNINQTMQELLSGKGVGAVGNFFKRQFDSVIAQMADTITENVFGDIFRDQKDKILGFDKVKESSLETARTSNVASDALSNMAKKAREATDALTGVAANDNPSGEGTVDPVTGDIVVSGRKESTGVLKDISKKIGKSVLGEEAFGKLSRTLKTGMEGAAMGQMASGLAKSLGIKQSKVGSQVGGAVGNAAFGPIGGIAGGLIGGTIGGFFKNSRSAGTTITGANSITVGGKDGKNYGAANELASSVVSGLQSIAEQLGGSIGSFNTTIGMRGGDYRVNTSGSSLKIKKGATDFNDDAEGAIKFAIADAIKDGAIIGLRAATQRLLQTGSDMDAQLAKAVKFQSVFDELESIKDPVSAAVKSLNREFEGLISVFREAGASAEEYAKLEELYSLKRVSAIESANSAAIGSFRNFIDGLTIGNDALSLRDRRNAARERYSALSERVKAGDTTAYDEYQQVASSLLDIQRQISGSQTEYFALLAEVTALSRSVVDATGKVASMPGSFANLMGGISSGVSAASATPNWSAYLAANPDVMRDYTAKAHKRFSTAESYGQWHYDNYGRAEGRSLPTSQADFSGAVTAQTQDLMAGFQANQSALKAINDNLITIAKQASGGRNAWQSALGMGGYW